MRSDEQINRRGFVATASLAAAGAASWVLGGMRPRRLLAADQPAGGPWKTRLHKALIGSPDEKTLTAWKQAGFEGIESTDRGASPEKAAAARKLADSLGMRIHSVLYGWANFNKPDAFEGDIAAVEVALRACEAYGADALLLVPCRIGGMNMPQPWEFDIELDERTGHLRRVVAGDNAPYADYIRAHDEAVDASRRAIERLIPTAEKTKVVLAIENVWNNLFVKPAVLAHFVRSFASPWVQTYFDIGNHVKYAPPEEWIQALGKTIVKCHVKDFKLNPDGRGGTFVDIRDGSVDWPSVRRQLETIGYSGWMTIEGSDGLSLDERSRRLDLIVAGK